PRACTRLAWMSCRKNSRSSNTSSAARKRMMRSSVRVPFFCQSRSLMEAPLRALRARMSSCATRTLHGNTLELVKSQCTIEILHGLRGCALQQVVERGDDHRALAARSHRETADLDAMLAGDAADPWRIINDADQAFVGVTGAVARFQRLR